MGAAAVTEREMVALVDSIVTCSLQADFYLPSKSMTPAEIRTANTMIEAQGCKTRIVPSAFFAFNDG